MKKCLSLLLTLTLLFALIPAEPASAAADVWDGTVDVRWYDPDAAEYYISTPAELAGLAAIVNGMTDPACPRIVGDAGCIESVRVDGVMLVGAGGGDVSDTVYCSAADFAYKTVYLTADLDMGGRQSAGGAWSGPNWTPIGGKFPMLPDEAAGDCLTLDTRFNGVLDGQGHTVSNIYCDRYAAKGFPYSMAIGLVGFLGGTGGESYDAHGGAIAFEDGWQPAVRSVIVGEGSILGRRMIGGVVGRIGNTNNGVIIENCANFAAVHSTDAKGVGGICGSAWGKGVIRGCYNAGDISTTYSSPAGGIVGTNEGVDIYCCCNIGTIDTRGQERGRAIGSHDTGVYTVADCVYLDGSGDDPVSPGYYRGNSTRTSISVTGMSAAGLKSAEALEILNKNGAVFVPDTQNINNGYPVLWYQNGASAATCSITVLQPSEGGTVSVRDGLTSAPFGQTVTLGFSPAEGWTLDCFTVNGEAVSADFFTVTGDAVVSAVCKRLRTVTVKIPESRDYYVAVSREGSKPAENGFDYVYSDMLRDGDTLVEGNVLTVLTYGYPDAAPADMDLEYIDAYVSSLPGAVANADGTYTVTGEADVAIRVDRKTQNKAWINYADTDWYLRSVRSDTYTLTTPEQLAGLAALVNRAGVSFAGITISLGNDISLENTDGTVGTRYWTPIGANAGKSFSGVFDGRGHAIYDLRVDASASYAGLFGCCDGATVKNLDVYGEISDSAFASYAGGVAAYVSGGRIENCRSYAAVTAEGTHAGGVAAFIRGGAVIENCANYGAVTAASGLGGVVGVSDTAEDVISGCANFGEVTSTGSATYGVGGIVGRFAGTVAQSVNYAPVGGADRFTGGVGGYAATRWGSTVRDSANRGAVSSANGMATAALGGVVGYAQYLILANAENTGTVAPGADFAATANVGDVVGRVGSEPVREESSAGKIPDFEPVPARTFPKEQKSEYSATFTAEGGTVAVVAYKPGDTSIAEPKVPEKAGYTGFWAPYALGEKDITVNAVYRQILAKGGDTVTDGTYHIAWFSSGTLTVAPGADVTLIGADGPFEGLCISAGRGASLTLEDTVLNGEQTMLAFAGDNTLTLRGENEVLSRADAEDFAAPAVRISGGLVIDGDGVLYAEAGVRNAAYYVDTPGSTVEIRGGSVRGFKDSLLGRAGGVFYANGSYVVVSGGEYRGTTVSDNVAALSSDGLTVTGGAVYAQSLLSPRAIEGAVTVSGGAVHAYGHNGYGVEGDFPYHGAESLPAYSGGGNVVSLTTPFTDLYVTDRYYDAAALCYQNGWFRGTSDTEFSPAVSMTRGMFATVLYRLAGEPAAGGETAFVDLTQDWYQSAVAWAVANGITNGFSDTEFSPDTPVTREQAAVFLYRYAAYAGTLHEMGGKPYHGAYGALSAWAEREALWALDAGLFDGEPDALSEPREAAPRWLLATALARLAEG